MVDDRGFWINRPYEWGYADNYGSDCLAGGDAMDGKGQSNGFRIANAMHQLISSSDFPEPVVPATMACGPDDARSIWNMPCSDMPMPFVGERTSQLRTMVRHMSGSLSRPCRCSKLMDGMPAKS